MQPNRDEQEWQQPSEQLSQAPYVAPPAPVETLDVQQPTPPAPVFEQTTAASAQPMTTDAAPTSFPTTPPQPYFDEATVDPIPQQAQGSAPEAQVQPQPVDGDDLHPAFNPVRWQANEHIARDKNQIWYVIFAIATVILMAVAIFLLHSYTFAVLIPVMAAALIVYTKRPPHVVDYTLSRQGLHINDVLNPFSDFKAFGVIHGDDEYSVFLIPTKRFKPGVSVYFPEEAGEQIVDMLAARLPMRELHLDFIDRLTRKLRI